MEKVTQLIKSVLKPFISQCKFVHFEIVPDDAEVKYRLEINGEIKEGVYQVKEIAKNLAAFLNDAS